MRMQEDQNENEQKKQISSLMATKIKQKTNLIQYKSIDFNNEAPIELSDEEKQSEFNKQHQQYMEIKRQRRREILKIKKQKFGVSSSDEQDIQSLEQQGSLNTEDIENRLSKGLSDKSSTVMKVEDNCWMIQYYQKKEWVKGQISVDASKIITSCKEYSLTQIQKIKIFQEQVLDHYYKINIAIRNRQNFCICAHRHVKIHSLPLQYYIFAYVIQNVLSLHLKSNLKENVLVQVPGVPEYLKKNAHIHGKIWKKSQFRKKWQQRYIVINEEGLYSYKSFNEKYSMFIQRKSVKQIWTRFQLHEQLLVIKILHDATKTQFRIPIMNFIHPSSWLYNFYNLT